MLPINKPWIGREEMDAVMAVIRTGDFSSQHSVVNGFETAFAKVVGAKFAFAVANESAARTLAVVSAQAVEQANEIWASPLTRFSPCEDIWLSHFAKINFCDLAPRSFTVDFDSLKKKFDPTKTNLIFVSHSLGYPAHFRHPFWLVVQSVVPRKMTVIEDCSEALGSSIVHLFNYKVPVGNTGMLGYFSFGKEGIIEAGEGACLVTNEETVFEKIKFLGADIKMNALQAAVGLVQLRKLPIILSMRRTVARSFGEQIKPSVKLVPPPKWAEPVDFCFPIFVANRDEVLKKLHSSGIGASALAGNFFRELSVPSPRTDFPNAELVLERVVKLPCFPGMTERDVTLISRIVNEEAKPCA